MALSDHIILVGMVTAAAIVAFVARRGIRRMVARFLGMVAPHIVRHLDRRLSPGRRRGPTPLGSAEECLRYYQELNDHFWSMEARAGAITAIAALLAVAFVPALMKHQEMRWVFIGSVFALAFVLVAVVAILMSFSKLILSEETNDENTQRRGNNGQRDVFADRIHSLFRDHAGSLLARSGIPGAPAYPDWVQKLSELVYRFEREVFRKMALVTSAQTSVGLALAVFIIGCLIEAVALVVS